MATPVGLTVATPMPYHHDPDSVMSVYLGCRPYQDDLYQPWNRSRPQDWLDTWDAPIPSASYGSGRSIRGRQWFSMWEAPLPVRSAVPRVLRLSPMLYYDEMPGDSPQQDIYEEVENSARIEHLKSTTKEETVEERTQKEKLARKKERRQARKARDLACKHQQRRARNQCPKCR